MRTQRADETLGLEGAHRGGDHEGLDAHVEQTRDAADGVIGVQGGEDQVTRECATDGDFNRLLIAHFTDHDDVGVTAQDAAQTGGEGEVDLRLHRDLNDAVQLVFHRVFDGDDAAVLGVQLLEQGVKRGALAGTGRTGDQDDSVRRGEQFAELCFGVGIQAEGAHVEPFPRQQTQCHGLAIDAGDGGDADVDRFSIEFEIDAPILRHAALGDVEMRHDFQTRNE